MDVDLLDEPLVEGRPRLVGDPCFRVRLDSGAVVYLQPVQFDRAPAASALQAAAQLEAATTRRDDGR